MLCIVSILDIKNIALKNIAMIMSYSLIKLGTMST